MLTPDRPHARGEACVTDATCAPALTCLALPGGYCASGCEACDGTCVETGRLGPTCMASCASDADCRGDEGYICDRAWHACSLPNLAAIVAKRCPGPALHDPAFGDAEPWATGREPSGAVRAGGFIALVTTPQGVAFAPEAPTATGHGVVIAHGASAAGQDRYYAAWRDSEAIELAVSTDGLAWSAPHPVQAEDGSPLGTPMLAAARGVLYVMYGEAEHGLRVRTSHDGGATFVSTTTPLAGAYGNAVVDAKGVLHVVTLDGDDHGGYGSAMQQIEYASSRDGATFTSPLVVSGRDELIPTYFANPSVAADARRRWLYVAYVRGGRDAVWDIVIAATHDAGKTWTRRAIGDGCAIHLVPNLALDPITGTLHVAYYDNAGATGRFVHATCTIGAAKCVVAGAINTLPFAALPLGRRGPLALGDHESLFVDADHRVIHALWAQPVVENDATVTRVFHAAAKLR
ncbi:MAG: sialidase family protein [Kofleriaceae bacterium]